MAQVSELGQLDFDAIVRGAQSIVQTAQGAVQKGMQTARDVQDVIQTGAAIAKDPLGTTIKSVTFATDYSPETSYTGQQLSDMYRDPTKNAYLSIIKPTITLDTILGKRTIAPYGLADTSAWKANVAKVAILTASVGLLYSIGIFAWGRSVGRKGR